MIDLDDLASAVGLPEDAAQILAYRAVIGLQRRHSPGVHLEIDVQDRRSREQLAWRQRERSAALYQDMNRVTEEGAEAIALAVACTRGGWRVERRLQSRLAEGADWLLGSVVSGAKLVLEVSGTDEGDIAALLARKLTQARGSPFAATAQPGACVVSFLEPSATVWIDESAR